VARSIDGIGPYNARFVGQRLEDHLRDPASVTESWRPWRKPLVVLSPKSLLRHPRVNFSLDQLASGRFRRVLADSRDAQTDRVMVCSGDVSYDLLKYRTQNELSDVAVARTEQFGPLRDEILNSVLEPYASGADIFWVQEEPENMGDWPYWRARFGQGTCRLHMALVARPPSASPATGSKESYEREQNELVARAFGQ